MLGGYFNKDENLVDITMCIPCEREPTDDD